MMSAETGSPFSPFNSQCMDGDEWTSPFMVVLATVSGCSQMRLPRSSSSLPSPLVTESLNLLTTAILAKCKLTGKAKAIDTPLSQHLLSYT